MSDGVVEEMRESFHRNISFSHIGAFIKDCVESLVVVVSSVYNGRWIFGISLSLPSHTHTQVNFTIDQVS